MSNSPRSPRKSGESKQLSVTPQTRSRRSSSISILDGRPLPPDSCPRPKITWAKGVEFLEHDCSIVIKTVNGKRVSKHPLLQGREPPKPKSGMLFTTGQKVEMYNPKSDKWSIARVRGKVRRALETCERIRPGRGSSSDPAHGMDPIQGIVRYP